MDKPSITFYSGADTVTSANFMLTVGEVKILVDCGLLQGEKFAEDKNKKPFDYDPKLVKTLLVTHAHLDHIGRIPKLVKEGFKGEIVSTEATKQITSLMFDDAIKIMSYEREKGEDFLYDKEDVERALSIWKTVGYYEPYDISDSIRVTAFNAGHILGSSMYKIEFPGVNGEKRSVIFSGDLGNSPSPLLPDTDSFPNSDYLVVESVYGDRDHEEKSLRKQKLADIVNKVVKKKGTLLIPAFSIEKTQVLLYELNELIENKVIKGEVSVFLDSPLAIAVTDIYRKMDHHFKAVVRDDIKSGDRIFEFPGFSVTPHIKDSKDIEKVPSPKIIIAGSGMSSGGRIVGHEKRYLNDKNNTILFVGYQAAGSLGRKIQEGTSPVVIDDEKVDVRASIETITGYSSHKDGSSILSLIESVPTPFKKVFVVLGEPKSSLFLVQRIKDYLDIDAIHPSDGEEFVLD
ncbi:MAG: hypothetical protein COV70_03290 [Parcubacteria group bacterium CG11_big_fil_rev_8_21_14_0_20_39_22]|nr:MAG: hypothetical protein COV70_03290 [Parcubacteria group bacterium CG11_big_fil_rev_8_21_14_0_20_39_22]